MAPPDSSSSAVNGNLNVRDGEIANRKAATLSTKREPAHMPGSFTGPDVSTSYYPPLTNGEFIDLTTPDIDVTISSLAMGVAIFAAKSALTGASTIAAYGVHKLGESEIPARVAEWLHTASEAAEDKVAEIDWAQLPLDVARWISENPKLAKSLGCVAAAGTLVYMPSRVPNVVWGYGMGVVGKTVAKAGLKYVVGVNPDKSMAGHFWSAVSGEYGESVQKGLKKTGEIAWKLAKRKEKRSRRKPAARKRKPVSGYLL